jgi:hypothetical protein
VSGRCRTPASPGVRNLVRLCIRNETGFPVPHFLMVSLKQAGTKAPQPTPTPVEVKQTGEKSEDGTHGILLKKRCRRTLSLGRVKWSASNRGAGSGGSRLTKIASEVLDHPDTAVDDPFGSSTGESGRYFPDRCLTNTTRPPRTYRPLSC